MLSFKDYATQHNISYESVRKQADKYKEQLEGHIVFQNKTRYLDEFAISFLDEHRGAVGATAVILHEEVQSKTERNEQLESENKELLRKIALLQDQVIALQNENKAGLEAQTQLKMLSATKESLEIEHDELTAKVATLEEQNRTLNKANSGLEQANEVLTKENKNLEKEKNSFVKSWFGLYKKKPL